MYIIKHNYFIYCYFKNFIYINNLKKNLPGMHPLCMEDGIVMFSSLEDGIYPVYPGILFMYFGFIFN